MIDARIPVALAALFVARPVVAQPVTSPAHCEVTIARAPEDVREVIEAWVRAEPRCTTTLEVRVVPSDGGLYLFARDGNGRVRERVVPDAQSVGVLIASWIADDAIDGVEAPPPSVQVVPPHRERGPMLAPPGETPAIATTSAPSAPPVGRWFTLGAMTQVGGSGAAGVRGELDLLARGRWRLAVGLTGSQAHLTLQGASSTGHLATTDVRAVASIARTSTFGRWQLRISAGAGVVRTNASGELDGDSITASGAFPTAEASVLFGRELGRTWAVTAGPVVTWYSQSYEVFQGGGPMELQRRDTELMAFAGLRHRM